MKKVRLSGNGFSKDLNINYIEIYDSAYRFSGEGSGLIYFAFNHNQRHTRLDLSNLRNRILVSFDKSGRIVTETCCHHTAQGPYELYNKQRNFLLMDMDSKFVGFNNLLFLDD